MSGVLNFKINLILTFWLISNVTKGHDSCVTLKVLTVADKIIYDMMILRVQICKKIYFYLTLIYSRIQPLVQLLQNRT